MKILFATDGSAISIAARGIVTRLPLSSHDEIVVLAVAEPLGPIEGLLADHDDLAREAEAEAKAIAERAQAGLVSPASITQKTRCGEPADEIVAEAEDGKFDLIVVGSHGRHGLKRFLLGAVSRDIMHRSPCAVLIGRPLRGESDAELLLVLAHDGSEATDHVVDRFCKLDFGARAKVHVLNVIRLVTMYRQDILQRLSPTWQARKDEAMQRASATATRMTAAGSSADAEVLEGANVAETLLDRAEELGADLIMVGHSRVGDATRVVLGSVASRIAEHANCSVWIEP